MGYRWHCRATNQTLNKGHQAFHAQYLLNATQNSNQLGTREKAVFVKTHPKLSFAL